MAFDISKLFQAKYLFDIQPASNTSLVIGFLIFLVLLILLSYLLKRRFKKLAESLPPYKKLQDRVCPTILACAIAIIVLIFFRWQELPYLSMRIFLIMLLAFMVVWLVSIIIYYKTTFKAEILEYKKQRDFKKYIPKPKKNKD